MVLEDWIRRWEEILKSGAGLSAVIPAYAALVGADAFPLFHERLYDKHGPWGACRDALIGIDDPPAARRTLFRLGTEEERERIWIEADEAGREQLLHLRMCVRWKSPWPERFRKAVPAGLDSDESEVLHRALWRVGQNGVFFGVEVVRRAEGILEGELSSDVAGPEGADASHDDLQRCKIKFWMHHRDLETEKRIYETPEPR